MSDIKLFEIKNNQVRELDAKSVAVEKSLQAVIERHAEVLLGVRFLATEHATGKTHGGRIDTLGIDENGCPVIIEYKRAVNQNVINQGLFYLDWLLDHKAEFKLLVMDQHGKEVADAIEWSSPRLLCIAGDFTKYDEHAVKQINRNIELMRYRKYGDDLLLLELVNAVTATTTTEDAVHTKSTAPTSATYKTITEVIDSLSGDLLDRWEAIKAHTLALGDDIQLKVLKYYLAFKRIKNFVCAEVRTQESKVLIYLKIDPTSVTLEEGFTRDVRDVGHYGTGDLEVTIRSDADFERAKPLILRAYEGQ